MVVVKYTAETITTYLAENQAHGVYTTHDARKGKLSHTAYRVLKGTKDFRLLEVNLLTGRSTRSECISPASATRWSATSVTAKNTIGTNA